MEPLVSPASPYGGASADTDTTFERILVPIDFESGTQRALATALMIQRRCGAEVHLFHLAEAGENDRFLAGVGGAAPAVGEGLVSDAEARLLRFVENLHPGRSPDVLVHARVGVDVIDAIRRATRDVNATLVILGGKRKQTVLRAPFEKIVRELDVPVMLVWAPDEPSATS
jgi:nucleotide-binding universal stress UspA family protein